jgi:hypothetical protein
LQQKVKAKDVSAGLTHKDLVDPLNISEGHLKVIRKRIEEADERLTRRLQSLKRQEADARREARVHVLSALYPDQRRKYDELIGEVLDFGPAGQRVAPGNSKQAATVKK